MKSTRGSTTFTLLPGEQLPAVLRVPSCAAEASQSSPPSEKFVPYYKTFQRVPLPTTLPSAPKLQPLEGLLEEFQETLEEKLLLARLMLRIQEAYEEREQVLRRCLSQEDVDKLISQQNPATEPTTVGAKYLRAVCEPTLRSFSIHHRLSSAASIERLTIGTLPEAIVHLVWSNYLSGILQMETPAAFKSPATAERSSEAVQKVASGSPRRLSKPRPTRIQSEIAQAIPNSAASHKSAPVLLPPAPIRLSSSNHTTPLHLRPQCLAKVRLIRWQPTTARNASPQLAPADARARDAIKNVIGVNPTFYEYLFTVDADATAGPYSLNRLISAMAHDKKVCEYFISHHMAKAFESLFGSVTCLPGCFTLFRLRTPDTQKHLLVSN
ncbi:chitin synthase-domain-containing protein [Boletus edulis]|nr:chitin synthase-domain-containing protein [Boletus edulis]